MTSDTNALSRRAVLRRGTVGVGVLGLGGVPGTAAAQSTVSGGGDALQQAIDAASDGDTITVSDSATYDPIVVDVSVELTASEDPTIEGDGGTGAAVSIEADGVALNGFTVTNPDGLLGVRIDQNVDDASVVRNTIEDVGPTGRLGVTGILVGQGDHDGIELVNNEIRNLDQETTEDSNFPTVNGILFDANGQMPGTLTDTTVNNNTIEEIESDTAPLGIVVQHETDGVTINNNEIRDIVADDDTDSDPSDSVDFGFTFAQGINIDSPSTADTTINRNVIEDVTSAETNLPEAVKVDGDGGGLTLRANQFLVAIGVNNRNGTDGGNRDPANDPEVDAQNNWWGSDEGPEAADFNQDADDDDRADVVGNVDFEPFLRNPPGRGQGRGQGQGQGGGQGQGQGGGQGQGQGN